MQKIFSVLLLLMVIGVACSGCVIARVQMNTAVKDIDVAWIEPGKTTFDEVIRRIGMPPPLGKVDGVAMNLSADRLHYIATDTQLYSLKVGFIITPLFERRRTVAMHDLLICFDEDLIVSQISRVVRKDFGKPEVVDFRGTVLCTQSK